MTLSGRLVTIGRPTERDSKALKEITKVKEEFETKLDDVVNPKAVVLTDSDFVVVGSGRRVFSIDGTEKPQNYVVRTETVLQPYVYFYNNRSVEGAKVNVRFEPVVTEGANLGIMSFTDDTLLTAPNNPTPLYGGGVAATQHGIASFASGDWTLTTKTSGPIKADGSLSVAPTGASAVGELAGDGATIKVSGNADVFGPNTIYVEGFESGAVQVAVSEGFSLYTNTGPDGLGTDYWDPFLQMDLSGVKLGAQGPGTGMNTTIHGGEYGIILNPGGTTGEAPVAINGRGEVMHLNAGIGGPVGPTDPGYKGAIGYFGGYMYLCVAPNTWVRAAVETTW